MYLMNKIYDSVQENIFDVISPMQFRLNYSIVNRLEDDESPTNAILRPILDVTRPSSLNKGVRWKENLSQ